MNTVNYIFRSSIIFFNIVMAFVPTVIILYLIHRYLKSNKFLKFFCFGMVLYFIKFIFLDSLISTMPIFKIPHDGFKSLIIFLKFISYDFVVAFFSFFSRFLIFKYTLRKDDKLIFNVISFAVGYCSLYNIFYCITNIYNSFNNAEVNIFKNSLKYIFMDGLNNLFVIITEIGYCLCLVYFLNSKSRKKNYMIILLILFDVFSMSFSEILVFSELKWYYNEIFIIFLTCLYLVFALKIKNKYDKNFNIIKHHS